MFKRHAIYYTFDGPLADRGAAWLGWDIASGKPVDQPDLPRINLAQATARARKYGFHATIKAPFALKDVVTQDTLQSDLETLCQSLSPVTLAALEFRRLGRFLALAPHGDDSTLKALAAQVVERLNPLLAPLSKEDFARRARPYLSTRQINNLHLWGYPHVMEDFQFHVTLTGPLKPAETETFVTTAKQVFAPVLPPVFQLSHLTLVGQREDGMFEQIARLPLGG